MRRAHKPATRRSEVRRLGDRCRERLRIRSCCLTRTDSATTERRPPGPRSRAREAMTWTKRMTRSRISYHNKTWNCLGLSHESAIRQGHVRRQCSIGRCARSCILFKLLRKKQLFRTAPLLRDNGNIRSVETGSGEPRRSAVGEILEPQEKSWAEKRN